MATEPPAPVSHKRDNRNNRKRGRHSPAPELAGLGRIGVSVLPVLGRTARAMLGDGGALEGAEESDQGLPVSR